MIFIALGTQKFQFNRLLSIVDDLIEKKVINEPVLAQVGYSNYKPKYFETIDFLSQHDFHQQIIACDLLITHGGVGSIINGLKFNKKVIVFPRLSKYKEHVDDHQQEIAKKYYELGYVLYATDENSLSKAILESKTFSSTYRIQSNVSIEHLIMEYLEND